MQAAVGERTWDAYERFVELVHSREPLELRDLVELTAHAHPVPVDEVEPEESILRRFSSGGMSHGSLSRRRTRRSLQRSTDLARARTRGGARIRCVSTERNSRIKQVASARFGVTAEYAGLRRGAADQDRAGSKPGEGGQLPGHKVTEEIARSATQPGIGLISPPPHRHLLDRGPGAADLRPAAGEPGRGRLGEARRRGGRGDGGGRRRPKRSPTSSTLPAPTAAPAPARSRRSRTQVRPVGARARGDAANARRARAARPGTSSRRRRPQDRTRRDRRRAARRRRGFVRHRAAARAGCLDGALVPPRHVPGRDRDAAARAARQVRRVAGGRRKTCASWRRRCGSTSPRSACATFDEAVGRAELLAARQAGRADVTSLLVPAGRGCSGEAQLEVPGGERANGSPRTRPRSSRRRVCSTFRYPISTSDRAVGARLGGEIASRFGAAGPPGRVRAGFVGSAGQSFGAFLTTGIRLASTARRTTTSASR